MSQYLHTYNGAIVCILGKAQSYLSDMLIDVSNQGIHIQRTSKKSAHQHKNFKSDEPDVQYSNKLHTI